MRFWLSLQLFCFLLCGCSFQALSPAETQPAKLAPQIDTVRAYETTVSLPTYPYKAYQSASIDPKTEWPYQVFDRERFLTDAPEAVNQSYRIIVLENTYLRLTILPELGGRLWQVLHKSSHNQLFYQNSVVKPSPWGPPNQLGWLALGGLEWSLPVIEHGYDWGSEWQAEVIQRGDDLVAVKLHTPDDGRLLYAEIMISLQAEMASFELQPTLVNLSNEPLRFDYWHTAMLAPGPQNAPSSELHFVLPGDEVIVHSTGDEALPDPNVAMTWPFYEGRELSVLGNWDHYLGLFEYPSAQGPFVGVYDRAYNAGGVRVFPAKTAKGSKLFGLGWNKALGSDYFTDDGSSYVELHGGLAPSFFEQAELAGADTISWRETWYPVQGINDLTYANELAAINLDYTDAVLAVALYPVLPIKGVLIVEKDGLELTRQSVEATPEMPLNSVISNISKSNDEALDIRLEDQLGRPLLTYTFQ